MFIKRCPWCGEELGVVSGMFRYYSKCPFCRNKYSILSPGNLWIYIPALMCLGLCVSNDIYKSDDMKCLAIGLSCLLIYPLSLFVPLYRWESVGEISTYSIKDKVKCNIKWNKSWHFLRFFIHSGFITPVVFFRDDNVEISDTWCGVFRKIRHIGKTSKCEFEFVVDEAPKNLLKAGNQFKIYYKNMRKLEREVLVMNLFRRNLKDNKKSKPNYRPTIEFEKGNFEHGGELLARFYLDAKGKACDKEYAVYCDIREMKGNDIVWHERKRLE